MCLIIDTCSIASVFNKTNEQHNQFLPVLNWVEDKGYLIYGGSKYFQEVFQNMRKYAGIFAEYKKKGKTIHIDDKKVDALSQELKTKIPDTAFNDEHIMALVILSRCAVVCTGDKDAHPFLKRTEIFKEYDLSRPKIFAGGKKHASLCCDNHIVGLCRQPEDHQ